MYLFCVARNVNMRRTSFWLGSDRRFREGPDFPGYSVCVSADTRTLSRKSWKAGVVRFSEFRSETEEWKLRGGKDYVGCEARCLSGDYGTLFRGDRKVCRTLAEGVP